MQDVQHRVGEAEAAAVQHTRRDDDPVNRCDAEIERLLHNLVDRNEQGSQHSGSGRRAERARRISSVDADELAGRPAGVEVVHRDRLVVF